MGDMAVMDMDTDMDSVISARGLLMPNPRLMLLLMLTMDTTAVVTDTDMVSVMAVTTDMVSVMAVDTTDMADTPIPMVDTAVTTVRLNRILACRSKNLFHNHIHPATNNNF